MKSSIFSVNNILILEPYQQGQGLKEEVRNGFAYVKQKTQVVGLKLLAEARLEDGNYLPVGSTVYISEELLTTQPWAKNVRNSPGLGKPFIVVEMKFVTMIDTNEQFDLPKLESQGKIDS
jgi:hypothetical protein